MHTCCHSLQFISIFSLSSRFCTGSTLLSSSFLLPFCPLLFSFSLSTPLLPLLTVLLPNSLLTSVRGSLLLLLHWDPGLGWIVWNLTFFQQDLAQKLSRMRRMTISAPHRSQKGRMGYFSFSPTIFFLFVGLLVAPAIRALPQSWRQPNVQPRNPFTLSNIDFFQFPFATSSDSSPTHWPLQSDQCDNAGILPNDDKQEVVASQTTTDYDSLISVHQRCYPKILMAAILRGIPRLQLALRNWDSKKRRTGLQLVTTNEDSIALPSGRASWLYCKSLPEGSAMTLKSWAYPKYVWPTGNTSPLEQKETTNLTLWS